MSGCRQSKKRIESEVRDFELKFIDFFRAFRNYLKVLLAEARIILIGRGLLLFFFVLSTRARRGRLVEG